MTVLPAPCAEHTPAYRSVRSASRLFKLLFTLLFAASSVAVMAVVSGTVFYGVLASRLGGSVPCVGSCPVALARNPILSAMHALPLWGLMANMAVTLLRAAPILAGLWTMRALFGLYAQGEIFTRETARCIRRLGLLFIVSGAIPLAGYPVLQMLKVGVYRADIPPWGEINQFIIGGAIIVFAQVMQVGREIEEDRSQFV